ncbi:phosphatase PAP2 family protein [Gracilibacillus marinus]|uniref:Phosphatase PAP2 family protein n=1 Tax=Gracilibacillus marinus TaxID=630535 RepID=A0ABV8VX87_9BACI
MINKWLREHNITILPIITLLASFLMLVLSMLLFIELAEEIIEQEEILIDDFVYSFASKLNETFLYDAMEWITEIGSVWFITVASVVVILYLLLTKKSKWYSLFFIINIVGIGLLTKIFKMLFERERPDLLEQYDGVGYSFPSGHTTGAVAFYGFVIYLISKSEWKKRWKITLIVLLTLLILTIAMSRIVLSVHFFTDIVAGLLLGFSWLLINILLLRFVLFRRKNKNSI